MDIAKVADIIIFVTTPNDDATEVGIDNLGYHFISIIKAQGLPTHICLMQGIEKSNKVNNIERLPKWSSLEKSNKKKTNEKCYD